MAIAAVLKSAWRGALCITIVQFGIATAHAQQAKQVPNDSRGVASEPLGNLELGNQIDLPGRQFRTRRLTIEPGGYVGVHDHRNRPAIIYIVQGQLTDHHVDGESREYSAGQIITETVNLRHWIENAGTTPTVLVALDLLKP